MVNQDSIYNTGKAILSSGTIEVLHNAPSPDTTSEIIKIVTQLLIAVATIFSILRRPRK